MNGTRKKRKEIKGNRKRELGTRNGWVDEEKSS